MRDVFQAHWVVITARAVNFPFDQGSSRRHRKYERRGANNGSSPYPYAPPLMRGTLLWTCSSEPQTSRRGWASRRKGGPPKSSACDTATIGPLVLKIPKLFAFKAPEG